MRLPARARGRPPGLAARQKRPQRAGWQIALASASTTKPRNDVPEPIDTAAVSDSVDTLILDLLEWLGPDRRPYAEVVEAWRTSCPRLPVWEDANDRGYISRHRVPGQGTLVSVSTVEAEHLRSRRQPPPR